MWQKTRKRGEKMSVEMLVKQKIKPLKRTIELPSEQEFEILKTKMNMAKEAGFTYQAEQLQRQIGFYEELAEFKIIMQKTNLKILFKEPEWEDSFRQYYNDEAHIINEPYLTVRKGERALFWVQSDIILLEQKVSHYRGNVPQFAVEATIKAKEAGLIPYIWSALEKNQIKRMLDPLVVGYINNNGTLSDHCLLIAAWGKDLETINNYFEN